MPGGRYYSAEENFHTWKPGTLEIPPGPRAYTNVGFGLLGYLVEVITGEGFSEYCWKYIFTPLGMKSTGWYLADVDVAHHAVPYTLISEHFKMPEGLTFEVPSFPGTGMDTARPKNRRSLSLIVCTVFSIIRTG